MLHIYDYGRMISNMEFNKKQYAAVFNNSSTYKIVAPVGWTSNFKWSVKAKPLLAKHLKDTVMQ